MKYIVSLLVLFTVAASAQELPSADSYAVNFDRNAVRTNTGRRLTAITLSGNTLTIPNPMCMYVDFTPQLFTAQPGQTLMPSVAFTGAWMQTYIYIDLNQNGRFDVQEPGPQGQLGADNELVSFAGMGLADGNYNSAGQNLADLSDVQPPAFTLPANISPGFYMMRWKIDWDDCDPGGRVDEQNSIIKNGGVIVDVLLRVTDEATEGYQLIFADEFDLPNGSRPDPGKWRSSTRSGSTWNRWISDAEEVAFLQDGNLVCRAIPNPDTSTDNVPMLTGAIETRGLFSFTYGKVEVRLQVDPYTGSFPAAWMMPQPPCEVWPNSGEIDIFESVDAQNTAFHTIHSHWSYDLGHKNDPKSSFFENVNIAQWHIYGVEWLENILIFTVDGNFVGTYARSNDEDIDLSNIETNELLIQSDKGKSSIGLAYEPHGWKGWGEVNGLDGTVHLVYNMSFSCVIRESKVFTSLSIEFEDDWEMDFADLKPGDTFDTNDFRASVGFYPENGWSCFMGTTATSGRLHVIDKQFEDGNLSLTLQIDNFKFDALDKECVYTIDGTIVYKLPQD